METTNRTANNGNSNAGQAQAGVVLQTPSYEPRIARNEQPSADGKQLPVKKFSTGVISATIWRNERVSKDGKVFETHSVNLQRRYANKNGEWMTSNSLRVADLPKAALVLEEAFKYLVLSGKGEEVALE